MHADQRRQPNIQRRFPPLALALRLGLSGVLCLPIAALQAQSEVLRFEIPAGPLDQALGRYARQAGVALSYDAAQVRGRDSQGLQGSYSLDDGFARLLQGSGLSARRSADGYVLEVAPAGPSLLPETRIDAGAYQESAWDPVDGYVAKRSASASKTDTPLSEIPQTVNVVTREQIQAQGAQNLTEAVRYTPGVIASFGDSDSRNDVLQSRGFYTRYNLNGSQLPFGAYSAALARIETYGLERVEILKGPASVMYGQGLPGGLVNMLSKRPSFEPLHEVQLQTGSHDRAQGAFDVSGPLDEAETLAYRLTGLARNADGRIDHGYDERRFIAPALTWQPSEDTQLTLFSHYQKDDTLSDYHPLPARGTLRSNPNGRLPVTRYTGEPGFDGYEREQYALGYNFSHRLNDTWTLRQNLQSNHVKVDTKASPSFMLDASGRQLSRVATHGEGEATSLTVDSNAQAEFATGALRHTALVGVDYLHLDDRYEFASNLYDTPIDIYDPVYGQPVPDLIPRIDYRQRTEQVGVYAQDQLKYDNWILTLGLRYDDASSRTRNQLPGISKARQDDSKVTGRIGLAYVFDNGMTPYLSYATSFDPTAGTDFSGQAFKPTTGEQYELGVKYQPPGSDSLITVSAFQLTQENVLTPDPINNGFNEQTGEIRVRGIELEGKTSLGRQLDLIASYAYMDSEVTRANPSASGATLEGNERIQVPAHQASAWLDYTLADGPLAGAGAGVGVRYQSKSYGDAENTLEMPGRTLVDAAVHYDLGRASASLDGLDLRVTASNLLDKRYVSYCQGELQCYYGQGRTALATLTYRW
ncbi:TonB-dependent siderophore receptor [Pseudomonas daroniae]|uniref:Metal-pseudopaline receptor CntO n=1 Tax=Phytopseudomonas daroniae TaxID=2487519 RepID=A0A4Q9QMF8_9GAMM|nr:MULTISPECIES: TonB-dependent siderophore receptor [Pseudomonas]TBU80757.1 TonB-dependent siderophore receptor [Pseudomonas daroniae]TBU81792.1 TonB-dependent siderophore receptor [Pseudomonas sp. FRB 228]TBU90781.1 TonB-dependent siderophore receptor [Pseudomonas daroniae]